MPVFSLPSQYGIGCFSKAAYTFVDQLKEAGQRYWQLLPLGPTGYGDSPYQSFSTYAGNPYFIDLETLIADGLLTSRECDACDWGSDERQVDYGRIYKARPELLRKAFRRSRLEENEEYRQFVCANVEWLPDYALFMAVKASFGDQSWMEWEDDIRLREPQALLRYQKQLQEEQEYHQFIQYQFFKQWKALKTYANQNGIRIIGDLPIYVALDSADSWTHPELFQMDEDRRLTGQAGCPPDGFAPTGQLWGNPLYDWSYHKKTGFRWWAGRIAHYRKLYDMVRIDHFRGLDEYYQIPVGHQTAEHGVWRPGPGIEIFEAITRELGELDIIAEDLGFLTDSVFRLLQQTGYPGMKVLQFAFDSRESGNYLPHNYPVNCIAYTGTHDNTTIKDWYQSLSDSAREFALEYLGRDQLAEDEICRTFIRLAQASVAKLCVIPVQDYLELGREGRINTPATVGGNWTWRLRKDELTTGLISRIRQMTRLYGRL